MRKRGFVLLTVLWVIVGLGTVAGAALAGARLGADASRNRILLLRARWAREACAEVLLARYRPAAPLARIDTLDLGRSAWCRAEVSDPGALLDINLASPALLRGVLRNDSLADALLDWRDADAAPRPFGAESEWYLSRRRPTPRNGPLADLAELELIRGFEDTGRLGLFTTVGSARVNLNAAPAAILTALPGLSPEAARLLERRRGTGRPVTGLDDLAASLSPTAREVLLSRYDDLLRLAAFGPPNLVAHVEGGVRGAGPVSRCRLLLAPASGRLAVLRREAD